MNRLPYFTFVLIAALLTACSPQTTTTTTLPVVSTLTTLPVVSAPTTDSVTLQPTTIPATESIVDVNQGLVAYYPLDGSAMDASENGLDGELFNTTFTSDRFGQDNSALQFNGADSILEVPDHDLLDLDTDFSLSFFIKGSSKSDHEWLILGKHKAGVCQPEKTSWLLRYSQEYGLRLVNYDVSVDCGKTILSAPDVELDDDNWHHLVIVHNKQDQLIALYLDTDLVISMDASQLNIQNNDEPFVIGNQHRGVPQHNLDAIIDDLRFYDQALELEVIEALYQYHP